MTAVFVGISILLNLLLVLVGRSPFFHLIAFFALIIYVAGPALFIAVVAMLAEMGRGRKDLKLTIQITLGIVFTVISTLVSLPFGWVLADSDIRGAKRYCESLIPLLEEHKQSHGEYPALLDELGNLPKPPRLLGESLGYRREMSGFRFSFGSPSGFLNGFAYSSTEMNWSEWD